MKTFLSSPSILVNESFRKNSDLESKKTISTHSKIIKTKKTKGSPAEQETLFELINEFRNTFGQNLLEFDPSLSKVAQKIFLKEEINFEERKNEANISFTTFKTQFQGESATTVLKNWIKDKQSLNSLLSPANKGYVEFFDIDYEKKVIVFITQLVFK